MLYITHIFKNLVLYKSVIFAAPTNIQYLKLHSTWYGDGTFAVSPDLFYQLYTLNIITKGKNLPLVYFLLPD